MYSNRKCRCEACSAAQREYGKRRRFRVFEGSKDVEHGTANGYKLGCRCILCKEANAEWAREYRARVEASGEFEHGTAKGYYAGKCRCEECRAAMATYARKKRIRSYGLTVEQFDSMVESQDGRCASCRDVFVDSQTTHIDHDHKTNLVRGLLCRDCNLGLGYFRDDPERLASILNYINSHNNA